MQVIAASHLGPEDMAIGVSHSGSPKDIVDALNSRIVQLAIIDTLYFYIVCNRSEKAIESIKQTEPSLLYKKY